MNFVCFFRSFIICRAKHLSNGNDPHLHLVDEPWIHRFITSVSSVVMQFSNLSFSHTAATNMKHINMNTNFLGNHFNLINAPGASHHERDNASLCEETEEYGLGRKTHLQFKHSKSPPTFMYCIYSFYSTIYHMYFRFIYVCVIMVPINPNKKLTKFLKWFSFDEKRCWIIVCVYLILPRYDQHYLLGSTTVV